MNEFALSSKNVRAVSNFQDNGEDELVVDSSQQKFHTHGDREHDHHHEQHNDDDDDDPNQGHHHAHCGSKIQEQLSAKQKFLKINKDKSRKIFESAKALN